MYTRCPKCQALYPLEAKDLRAGRGEVQCDRCHILFSALGTLADSPEQAHADPYTVVRIPTLGRPLTSPAPTAKPSVSAAAPAPGAEAPATAMLADADITGLRAEPRFTLPQEPVAADIHDFQTVWSPARPNRTAASLWTLAVLIATGALGLQALMFESERLAQRPGWRPWVERLCPLLDCPIPPFRDLAHIQVVERSLTPAHGGVDGQEFRAVLANYADRPQPYPRLKLTLNQYNGDPIAQRIFTPQQYLESAGNGLMPIAAAVAIHLLIANPGKDVGGFSIDLL